MRRIEWLALIFSLALGASFFVDGEEQVAQITKWGRLFYGQKLINVQKVTWGGRVFERSVLSTRQYKTDGNKDIKFTDSGFYAPSYSMPRSKLLDINMNKKVKVKISGVLEGEMKSSNEHCTGRCITTERYNFSEFSIYLRDENGNSQGMRNLGTRDNVTRGNTRSKYKFTELTVENTGEEIIVTDSSGFKISYSPDFKYITSHGQTEENHGGNYGKLNPNQKWFLVINCHVNGEGYCKLDVKDIQVVR